MIKPLRLPVLIALLVGCPAFINLHAALTDGLVSYWPLDVDQGGTTPDLSFANTLTISGTAVVGAGQFSNAFTFDGTSTLITNQHTYDNNETGLSIYNAGAYTICFWVKGAAQTARYIFSEGNTTNNNALLLIQSGNVAGNNSKLDILLRNTRNQVLINHVVSTNVVFDNTWHHIAWTDDHGFPKLYIDGVLDGTSTNSNYNYVWSAGDLQLNTTALGNLSRLAVPAAANYFTGQLDEVAVWERALSADEVNQVRTNGVFTPGTQVPARPIALTQVPASATKKMGEWHLLSVDVTGNRPITYQWRKNGAPITDATNRYYKVINLQTNNTGDFYSVAVTNPSGFALSTNATLTVTPDAAPNLANGLVDYWPLDIFTLEDTNVVSPELHFGHRMVMRNMDTNTQIVPGQFSNAVFVLATLPTYGYRSNGVPIYTRTNYTVSLWVKGNGVGQGDRRVFSEGRDGGNNNPVFSLGTDNAGTTTSAYPFVRNDAGGNSPITARLSTRAVFDDAWHHVVWTDANGDGKLYVDGNLDETDYKYIRPALTLNLTMIGVTARTPAPVTPFTGSIDEVATWSRVLSWTEIQQVMTNGIPIPEGIVAPSIAIQPLDRTNNVFVSDNVTFFVSANGSLPFDYQWRRNGVPISGGLNPTALTDTLVLTNVQVADSNTTYSVVITNAAGSATSATVRLYVKTWSPSTNGEVLKADIDLSTTPNVQPGFASMTLAANPLNFDNAVRVTLSPDGAAPLAERLRVSPPDARAVVNNPPHMTQAQLYNDFVFANGTGDGTGLQVLIERLAPNTKFGLTVWSFDPVSSGLRFADWNEISSDHHLPITNSWVIGGVPITITNNLTYIFDGAIMPTNDYAQTLGGLFTSSPTGTLQLQALKNGGASFGAFVNAIRLVANPTATRIRSVNVVASNLRIEVEGEYPGQPIWLEQKANLNPGAWSPAAGATLLETRGPLAIFEVPLAAGQVFYRAASYLP